MDQIPLFIAFFAPSQGHASGSLLLGDRPAASGRGKLAEKIKRPGGAMRQGFCTSSKSAKSVKKRLFRRSRTKDALLRGTACNLSLSHCNSPAPSLHGAKRKRPCRHAHCFNSHKRKASLRRGAARRSLLLSHPTSRGKR